MKVASNKNVGFINVPQQTLDIFHKLEKGEQNEQKSILMNLENLNDKEGELDQAKVLQLRKQRTLFRNYMTLMKNCNYSLQFESEDKNKFKEIELLKFDSSQMQQYIEKFTLQSVKIGVIDIKKFEIFWEQLQKFLKKEISGLKGENLLNQKQINHFLFILKNDEFIALKSHDALRSLGIQLQKLWSFQKYNKFMKQIKLNRLVVTPYMMMEIIVQVLLE
ncbi:unnamed protein product [Paramecium pentaurelia]|uniref:Uncharacterized protein n=1 Tax=Paramecium pentaurelia TaxID=43138 RepID=A0A8S1XR07_9CILI|nr:unnamed protein product [Paramecium pentaurelia]